MIKYGSDIVIDRPVREVSSFALDPDSHPRWMGDVVNVKRLSDGDLAVGSRFRYAIRKGPMAFDPTFRVMAYDPDHRIEYQSEPGGPLSWTASLEFEPVGDGQTRVRSIGRIGFNGLRRLLEPLMAGEVRAGEAAELVALKQVIEQRPRPVTSEPGSAALTSE